MSTSLTGSYPLFVMLIVCMGLKIGLLVAGLSLAISNVSQMILLYQDPYGKKSTVVHHTRSDSKRSNGIDINAKTVELENKVASLEKTVQEGEKTIAELRQRIETLTKENSIVQV